MSDLPSGVLDDLIRFARDQLRVLGRPTGKLYISDCMQVWREEYGEAVARAVWRSVFTEGQADTVMGQADTGGSDGEEVDPEGDQEAGAAAP